MITFLIFLAKMITLIFAMKYISNIIIAIVTKEKPKKKHSEFFDDVSEFRDK